MKAALHQTFRYLDAAGWRASCWCGWRATKRTRELRDQASDAHELTGLLAVRPIECGEAG